MKVASRTLWILDKEPACLGPHCNTGNPSDMWGLRSGRARVPIGSAPAHLFERGRASARFGPDVPRIHALNAAPGPLLFSADSFYAANSNSPHILLHIMEWSPSRDREWERRPARVCREEGPIRGPGCAPDRQVGHKNRSKACESFLLAGSK